MSQSTLPGPSGLPPNAKKQQASGLQRAQDKQDGTTRVYMLKKKTVYSCRQPMLLHFDRQHGDSH